MATKTMPTAKAEATPKAKRTKTPPPTVEEVWQAIQMRRANIILFRAMLEWLNEDLLGTTTAKVVTINPKTGKQFASYGEALDYTVKLNAQLRRAAKANIRRANKVIQRYEKSISTKR